MRATSFDSHREHLLAVAYRMLGSRVEAEDAVQEAWLRYTERRPEVDDLRGWLITVVARISLDLLRSARVRRERYVGSWLPEPVVTRLPGDRSTTDPAEVAVRDEQVGLALLVVLDRLPPEQRIAFVLHDAFAVPFEAIAEALGTSTANARQLASRARTAVRTAAPAADTRVPVAEQRRVLAAFVQAADQGDLAGLARVLAPEVRMIGDGGGLAPALRQPLAGIDQVGAYVIGLYQQARRRPPSAELVWVNDSLGFVVEAAGQVLVIAPIIRDGQIVAIFHQLNPDKLRGVPRPDPARATWPPPVHIG